MLMGRGGLNEPTMTKNGPNDVSASFGPLVSFFHLLLILTKTFRFCWDLNGSGWLKRAGDEGKRLK